MKRMLVTGGRDFTDKEFVFAALDKAREKCKHGVVVIEGGARGADALAREWAIARGQHYAEMPALWDSYHNSAGPIRNRMMLVLQPDMCVAFPGGSGTADMVSAATQAGVPVWQPKYTK